MTDRLLEHGGGVLASQPFSQLLGTALLQLTPGFAELSLALTERLTQQHG